MSAMPAAAQRYALYLAPAKPWWQTGSRWLGRDAATGAPMPRSANDDPRLEAWTEAPRLYGLHATLKPPLRLRDGASPADIDAAARALARRHAPFTATLRLRRLRGFLAWVLDEADAAAGGPMRRLADDAMSALDGLRAAPTPQERARRLAGPLSPTQRAMLDRWGYPYAMDTYTFHISLTGSLDQADLARAEALLATHCARLPARPMPVQAVSLYVQPGPGEPFLAARHYGFDGSAADAAGAAWLAP